MPRACSYCHGKRKVNTFFVKWEQKRNLYIKKEKDKYDAAFNIILEQKLISYDKKHIKPVKF
jgi:hypothetical protein